METGPGQESPFKTALAPANAGKRQTTLALHHSGASLQPPSHRGKIVPPLQECEPCETKSGRSNKLPPGKNSNSSGI